MKKTLIAIALTASTILSAGGPTAENCKQIYRIATSIMQSRQMGTPVMELVEASNGNKYFKQMVLAAYETPRYMGDKYIKRTVENFANTQATECLKLVD